MTRPTVWFLRMTLVFLLGSEAVAQLPFARIDSVYPPSGQIGTEVEVTLTGPELANSTALLFDTDKITATKVEAKKFRVALGADCPPGLHDVRAIGPTGISTPTTFFVGDTPEALDSGDNHSRAKAQEITPPCAVSGVFDSEAFDVYRFSAKAGQALAINCLAQLIDSPANPTIVLRDPAGREIARALNTHDRDAALEFTPAANGEYFVEVFDHLFAGSPQHIYRLAIADGSRSNSPLPRTPASCTIPNQEGLPMIAESEPNDTFAQAQKISVPCVISGTQLDQDWFEFHADKDAVFWFDIISDREGWAADPLLVIYKVTHADDGTEQNSKVAEIDDQPDLPKPPWWGLGSRDAVGRFVADEAATYRVLATDRFHRQAPLRLVIRNEVPDFALVALAESPANEDRKIFTYQPVLRRGGSAFFHVAALRHGYDGPIELRVEGLPEGVTGRGVIEAGQTTGCLTFHAASDSKPWTGRLRVLGAANELVREAHGITYRWNAGEIDNVRLDARLCDMAMSVADEDAPLTIRVPEEKDWTATIGEQLEIPVTITHTGDVKGQWQLKPLGLAGMAKPSVQDFDGGSATEAKLALNFANKDGNTFKPGRHTFVIRALGVVKCKPEGEDQPKDRKHAEVTQAITVNLVEPPPPATATAAP